MADTVSPSNALDRLARLMAPLADDVSEAVEEAIDRSKLGKEKESQRARRNAARALFAQIDGVVYGLKEAAYEVDRLLGRKTFNRAEVALLRDEEYTLQDNGKARTRPARLRTEANLRFAFDAFARAFSSPAVIDVQGEGWEAFRRALRVRHRLTHPKNAEQIEVSIDELTDLVKAWRWFITALETVLLDAGKRSDVGLARSSGFYRRFRAIILVFKILLRRLRNSLANDD